MMNRERNLWWSALSLAGILGSVTLLAACGGGHAGLIAPPEADSQVDVQIGADPQVPRAGVPTEFVFTLTTGNEPIVGVTPILTVMPGVAEDGEDPGGHAEPHSVLLTEEEHEDDHECEEEDEHNGHIEEEVEMTPSDSQGRSYAHHTICEAGPHTLTIEFEHDEEEVTRQFVVVVAR